MLEAIVIIGTGFAVVMSVLASIWGACALIGAVFVRAERAAVAAKAVATPAPAAAPAAAQPDASGVPPHHLAAIAAAVAHTLGAGYRVTRVSAPAHEIGDWPLEGRFETFTANRVRTDWGPTRVAQAGPHTK